MSKLDLQTDIELDVREHREQREQPNNDVGFERSQEDVPAGNNENPLPIIIIDPVDTPPPILLNPKIDRPCYRSYPDWFQMNGKKLKPGLYLHGVHTNNKGETTDIDEWISSSVTVEAITSSSETGADFGRLLKFVDSNRKWHEWAMPMSMLKGSGEELRGELLNQGLIFNLKKRSNLMDYIMREPSKRRIIAATRVGWHDGVFVLPHQVIANNDADVVFQSEMANESEFKMHGTLEGWKNEIGKLCSGNTPLMVSICMALAGPLLKKVNRRQGGAIHWVGDSSTGKSTAAEVAATIWGSSDFINSWSATANGLEGRATMRNDTCLILDEIDEASPQEIGNIVYMLANGHGKQRARRIGTARKIQHWRTMTISTGERTLANIMFETKKHPNSGQLVRLLNIPAGFKDGIFSDFHGFKNGRSLADHLKSMCEHHYGYIGPAFVRCLMEDKRDFPALLATIIEAFPEENTSKLSGRAAGTFAIIGMAGELGIEYGLLPWLKGMALSAAINAFYKWQELQGSGESEDNQILQEIRSFTAKHGDSRFSLYKGTDDNGMSDRTPNRIGWYQDTERGRVYMVYPTLLEEVAGGRFTRIKIVTTLLAAGWIVDHDTGGRHTKKTRLTKTASVSFYYILVQDQE